MFLFRSKLETLISQPYTPKKDPDQSHVVLKTQEYAKGNMVVLKNYFPGGTLGA